MTYRRRRIIRGQYGMYPKKTRRFNGKTFTREVVVSYKRDAKRYAKLDRADGYKIRVVKSHGMWVVYRRR